MRGRVIMQIDVTDSPKPNEERHRSDERTGVGRSRSSIRQSRRRRREEEEKVYLLCDTIDNSAGHLVDAGEQRFGCGGVTRANCDGRRRA